MPSLASLFLQETKAQIYARGLALAEGMGLTPSLWPPNDPTRSLYHFAATVLALVEPLAAAFVASGFLEHASGDWLTVMAEQVYGVTRAPASYASGSVTITCTGAAYYDIEVGDIVVRSSATGKTYTNTTGGTFVAPGSISLDFTADEIGEGSAAAATTIDTMITRLVETTSCSNASAFVAVDEESDDSLRFRCRAKLGTLSACGPRDAYDFVVRDSAKTGSTEITRSRTIAESTTGNVTVYVAGPSGAVGGGAVTAAQAAVEEWAGPMGFTPTVSNTRNRLIFITYEAWLYSSVGEDEATIEATIETALGDLFAARPIGGDVVAPATRGKLYRSLIESAIREVYPAHTFRVVVSSPVGDTALDPDEVVTVGSVTATVHLEPAP